MAAPSVGRAPFVGRVDEMRLLDEVLERTSSGEGSVVLVTGEAGIGKTRLADELLSRAAGMGLRTLWGRSWEGDGAPPFWPWIQALRGLLEAPAARDVPVRMFNRTCSFGREVWRQRSTAARPRAVGTNSW